MNCTTIAFPGGGYAIVCGRARKPKKCGWCSKPSALQCDWKLDPTSGKTCDAHICTDHAEHVGENKDLCPVHQKAYEKWKQRKKKPATTP